MSNQKTLNDTIDFLLNHDMANLLKNYPIQDKWPYDIQFKMKILIDSITLFHKYPFITSIVFNPCSPITKEYEVTIGNDGLLFNNQNIISIEKRKIWSVFNEEYNNTFDDMIIPTSNGLTSKHLIQKDISETFAYLNIKSNKDILDRSNNLVIRHQYWKFNYIDFNLKANPILSEQFLFILGKENIQFIKNFDTFDSLNSKLPNKKTNKQKKL